MIFQDHLRLQGKRENIGGKEYYFFNGADTYGPQKAKLPGFMSGAEGFAHPIRDNQGQKYILKSFQILCDERIRRMQWLSARQLCKYDKLLGGAPYQFFGEPYYVQICSFVEGQTWSKWKSNPNLKLTPAQRIILAHSLASTACLLEESIELVHGDFSPGNVIIKGNHTFEMSLIDFDAYFHKQVPVLPKEQGRTRGTFGYQFSDLAKNEHSIVRSDRFAMAVLIHEFLCFDFHDNPGTEDEHLLITQDDIASGQARPDANLAVVWGNEINDLAWKALRATKQELCPSPREWRTSLEKLRQLLIVGEPVLQLLVMRDECVQQRLRISKGPKVYLKDELNDPRADLVIEKHNNIFYVWNRKPEIPARLNDAISNRILEIGEERDKRRLIKGSIIHVNNWKIKCVERL